MPSGVLALEYALGGMACNRESTDGYGRLQTQVLLPRFDYVVHGPETNQWNQITIERLDLAAGNSRFFFLQVELNGKNFMLHTSIERLPLRENVVVS